MSNDLENAGSQPTVPNAQSDIADAQFGPITPEEGGGTNGRSPQQNLELLYEIPLRVNAELGHTTIKIKDLLSLGPGAVVELDRLAGESIDLMVNGVLIGKGDVVVVNENFGLRITEIVCVEERLKRISN